MPKDGVDARQEAFDRLLRNNARVVASAIRRVCGRRHGTLVPDIEQEVYVALWKRLQSGKEIEHPVSYIYKVALTTALAVVRRHVPPGDLSPRLEDPGDRAPAFLGLAPAEQTRLLSEALEKLPPDEARAVRAYLAGFNHEELAKLYGWTPSIARHRIYRGLEKVRRTMRPESE